MQLDARLISRSFATFAIFSVEIIVSGVGCDDVSYERCYSLHQPVFRILSLEIIKKFCFLVVFMVGKQVRKDEPIFLS